MVVMTTIVLSGSGSGLTGTLVAIVGSVSLESTVSTGTKVLVCLGSVVTGGLAEGIVAVLRALSICTVCTLLESLLGSIRVAIIVASAATGVSVVVSKALLTSALGSIALSSSCTCTSSSAAGISCSSRLVTEGRASSGSSLVGIAASSSSTEVTGRSVAIATSGTLSLAAKGTVIAVVVVFSVMSPLPCTSVEAGSLVCISVLVCIALVNELVGCTVEALLGTISIPGGSTASVTIIVAPCGSSSLVASVEACTEAVATSGVSTVSVGGSGLVEASMASIAALLSFESEHKVSLHGLSGSS